MWAHIILWFNYKYASEMSWVGSPLSSAQELNIRWYHMHEDISFFFKLKQISRFNMQYNKHKARNAKKEKNLDTKAKLGVGTAILHEDRYNVEKQ